MGHPPYPPQDSDFGTPSGGYDFFKSYSNRHIPKNGAPPNLVISGPPNLVYIFTLLLNLFSFISLKILIRIYSLFFFIFRREKLEDSLKGGRDFTKMGDFVRNLVYPGGCFGGTPGGQRPQVYKEQLVTPSPIFSTGPVFDPFWGSKMEVGTNFL